MFVRFAYCAGTITVPTDPLMFYERLFQQGAFVISNSVSRMTKHSLTMGFNVDG